MFRKFRKSLIRLLDVLDWQSYMAGTEIVITGADGEPYTDQRWLEEHDVTGVAHSDGRALDLRSSNFPNPAVLAAALRHLGYDVRFGDPLHLHHIHVGIPRGWK